MLRNTVSDSVSSVGRPREYDEGFRRRVIDVAGRLLATEGPHAVSVRRVASEVGASTAAIYRMVGAKDDLVRAMYLEGFARLADALAHVAPDGDPLARLAALGDAYLDVALADPSLYTVMFERPVPEFHPGDDDRARALATLGVLVDAVGHALDVGAIPASAGDRDDIAVQLWVLAHGVASLAVAGMLGTDREGAHRHLRSASTALLSGLAAR